MSAGTLSPAAGTPAAEIEIDDDLVAALIADQHPDLACLPLQFVDVGWDNAMYRLGDELAVRIPRRALGAALVVNEQRWLPGFAGRLPLPVPVPVRVGTPASGYPWSWSIIPWLHGKTADIDRPAADQALRFATFLRALHVAAPEDAPFNPGRGIPLRNRAAAVEERMSRLLGSTAMITPRIEAIWRDGVNAPIDLPRTWLHGDLHPRNILVENGVISGIIDWGDITAGDCATDLASIWMLFEDPSVRRRALDAYGGVSEATLRRARGWAVLFGVMLLDSGLVDNPQHASIGEGILRRLDEEGGRDGQ